MPRGCSEKSLEHFATVRDWRKSEDNGLHGSIPLAVVPNPQIGAPIICRLELLYFAPRSLIGQQTPQLPKERELVMMRTHSPILESAYSGLPQPISITVATEF